MANLDIFESGDRYCLSAIIEEELPDTLFAEHDLQGGGYTWAPILQSLIALNLPAFVEAIEVGAEADNFYAYADTREILDEVASLLKTAINDRHMLQAAIDHAGDEIE